MSVQERRRKAVIKADLEFYFDSLFLGVRDLRNDISDNKVHSFITMLSIIQDMCNMKVHCRVLHMKVCLMLEELPLHILNDAHVKQIVTELFEILDQISIPCSHQSVWDIMDFHKEEGLQAQLFYLKQCNEAKIKIKEEFRVPDLFASMYANIYFVIEDNTDYDFIRFELPTLRNILNYGITSNIPSTTWLCCHPLHSQLGVDILVRLLECYFHCASFCSADCPNCIENDQSIEPQEYKKIGKPVYIDCVRLLLRALPPFSLMELFRACHGRGLCLGNVATAFDAVATDLPHLVDRVAGISSLQHLCRCTIRRRLFENWDLPDGNKRLPLPSWLKDYISLEYD